MAKVQTQDINPKLRTFLEHHGLLLSAEAVLAQHENTDVLTERWLKAAGLSLTTKHQPSTNTYVTKVPGVKLRTGDGLASLFGRGATPAEAMASFGDRMRGRTIVKIGLGIRQEFVVPIDLGASSTWGDDDEAAAEAAE